MQTLWTRLPRVGVQRSELRNENTWSTGCVFSNTHYYYYSQGLFISRSNNENFFPLLICPVFDLTENMFESLLYTNKTLMLINIQTTIKWSLTSSVRQTRGKTQQIGHIPVLYDVRICSSLNWYCFSYNHVPCLYFFQFATCYNVLFLTIVEIEVKLIRACNISGLCNFLCIHKSDFFLIATFFY